MIALSVGCASQDATVSNSNESRQIVDIIIDEIPDSLILSIRGNKKLAHTEDRQVENRRPVRMDKANPLFRLSA